MCLDRPQSKRDAAEGNCLILVRTATTQVYYRQQWMRTMDNRIARLMRTDTRRSAWYRDKTAPVPQKIDFLRSSRADWSLIIHSEIAVYELIAAVVEPPSSARVLTLNSFAQHKSTNIRVVGANNIGRSSSSTIASGTQ